MGIGCSYHCSRGAWHAVDAFNLEELAEELDLATLMEVQAGEGCVRVNVGPSYLAAVPLLGHGGHL